MRAPESRAQLLKGFKIISFSHGVNFHQIDIRTSASVVLTTLARTKRGEPLVISSLAMVNIADKNVTNPKICLYGIVFL